MAAIFQLRRGITDVNLTEGELYLHKGSGSIQFGSGSTEYNLLPLNTPAYGNIDLVGNISASGDVRIGGNIYLGDSLANDTVNVNSPFSGSIIPSGSNTFDLGTSTTVYRNVYANRVSASFFTGSLSGSVNGIDITNFSTSVDTRLDSLEIKTGSYATTGSNNFIGNQNITGSLIVSGSNIEFTRDWPAVGTESHFLRVAPFTGSDGRYYDGLGIGIEHWEDETGTYEHSLQIHTWDSHINSTYGSELNVGPYRTHMRMYPSGSGGSWGNVSVQDLKNGKTQALVYGDYVQIGAVNADFITIGNTGSLLLISSSNILVDSALTSSQPIVATLFSGSISGIGNVTEFSSSISDKFASISTATSSFDNRLDRLEESTQSLNDYTQSLKSTIDVTGGNLRVFGDLIIDGNTTNVNTQNLYIEDKIITLASGSIDSLNSNGAGFEIEGAGVSMSWEHSNTRFLINTNVGIIGSISSSTIVGLNGVSVSTYSTSVDSRLTNLEITSASILGHISDINLKTGSFESKFTTIQSLTASYDIHTSSLNTFTQSVNGHISDLNSWTASQNEKDTIISNITASYNGFTGSATASIVELFFTSSNHESRIDDLEVKATTLGTYTASVDSKFVIIESLTASYNSATASLNQFTSSTYSNFSTSVDQRLDELEYTTSINLGAGAQLSFTQINAFTASASGRLDNLELNSASLNLWSSSLNTIFTTDSELTTVSTSISTSIQSLSQSLDDRLDQLETDSGSQNTRITILENKATTLQTYTASVDISISNINTFTTSADSRLDVIETTYATTGSNTFYGTQVITGSTYISGDLIVQGSSSLQNITASAVSIGTNIVYLNTDTPAVRFAGLSVFDSGSTQATGSLLYDSQNERWVYQKSSGSSYNGGMLISGPRNTGSLGDEIGMPTNKLIMGMGGDHISSSGIYHNGTDTAFGGNLEVTGSTILGTANITTLNAGNGIISGSTQLSGTTIPNLSGSFTGSFKGNLAGVADYAQTVAVSSVGTTTDTTLYPTFTTNAIIGSYSSLYSHLSASFYYNGVTRKVYGEAFVGAIESTNGVVSGSSQINFSGVTGTISNFQLANSTISGISLGSSLQALTIGTGLSGTSYNGGSPITISLPQEVATTSNVQFGSLGIGTTTSGVSGEIRASGDITAFYSSDERLKENIQPIQNALSKIESISGNTYDWKEGFETIHSHTGHDLGVIAQEVKSVLPEIVTERETGYLAVDYVKLVPVLIEAIKELSAKVKELESK